MSSLSWYARCSDRIVEFNAEFEDPFISEQRIIEYIQRLNGIEDSVVTSAQVANFSNNIKFSPCETDLFHGNGIDSGCQRCNSVDFTLSMVLSITLCPKQQHYLRLGTKFLALSVDDRFSAIKNTVT
ncbi:unnamed protein product [Ceratitis capitata]|uniref:(Mediterranean fruit fly) hypothetical protein n=1 Tax=Ceratitis capitata TaxID=7213 RepID=A0A811UXS8_CERCA|nr:unnamed protein product [Ceratitis capitata]